MTSYHGVWQVPDIIQAYELNDIRRYPPKGCVYPTGSIMDFLIKSSDHSIFTFIVKTAQMDVKLGELAFDSTVFICSDTNIRQTYQDEFFMRFDRNIARTVLNYNILNRKLNLESLLSRMSSKVDSKNPRSELNVRNINGFVVINKTVTVLGEKKFSNGVAIETDGLLIPENLVQNC